MDDRTVLNLILVFSALTLYYVTRPRVVAFAGPCPKCREQDKQDVAELFGPAESRRHKPKEKPDEN